MKVVRVTSLNLLQKKTLNILEKKMSRLQNKIIEFEVKSLKSIYKIEINKEEYKKYKQG